MRSRGSSREVDPYSGEIEEIGHFSLNFEKQTKIQTRVAKNVQILAQINTSKLGSKFKRQKSTPKMTVLKNQDLFRMLQVWDII